MSFRSFILYCALCGGWAALLSWALGRFITNSGIRGLLLGLLIALALALVDALWNFTMRQASRGIPQVCASGAIGAVGGLMGGAMGQLVVDKVGEGTILGGVFLVFGWTVTGLLIGASVGTYEAMNRFVREQPLGGSMQKIIKGTLGGTVGGFLGGILYLVLWGIFGLIFKNASDLWSPSAAGFVALGACIGLMIGLAQVIFRQAWLRVEAGFRAGREVILVKPEITIGRAESCDIGLFGDSSVDKLHARLIQEDGHYVLVDAGSKGGTFLNDEPVEEPTTLRSGDVIQLGNSVLSFKEKEKRGEQ